MKNTLETRLGIFVALAVIAAVLILETVGGVERFQRGYELRARFNNVQDLKVGDRIKMAGVEVGRVERIGLAEQEDKVEVTVKLRKEVKIRSDSLATIKFTGLMGQSYIALNFGSAGAPLLKSGDYLNTAETADLSAIMQKIDNVVGGVENLTKTFSGDKLDNLMGPLVDILKANKEPLTMTVSNLQAISSQIAQGKGTVGRLIYEDTLYRTAMCAVSNLETTATEIRSTVADAHTIVDQVKTGRGTVGKLVYDETLYNEAAASMTNFRAILEKVNNGQGSVGRILNDPELYKNAKLTLQKLDQATEGLEDQGPLSVLGTAVGKLF
jgi:phospholipid/cholesterol/gamma-HCH transport system substrate-binding protein